MGKMQIAGRSAGRHYESPSTVVRNEAKGKCVHSFSIYKCHQRHTMQGNGDVNVSYMYNYIYFITHRLYQQILHIHFNQFMYTNMMPNTN